MDDRSTHVGWEEVERLVERLAAALRTPAGAYDRVVGVSRGGLAPAVLLAGRLGIRRVDTVQVRHYDGSARRERPEVGGGLARLPDPGAGGGRTLVVDDVYETGGTLRTLSALIPRASCAVLVVKHASLRSGPGGTVEIDTPDGGRVLGARSAPPERWVVFPWSDRGEAPA